MTSDCLGENRITSAPNRAISNRAQAAAIISIAQQARPIGIGQSEFFRIQLMQASRREKMTLPCNLESYPAGSIVTMREPYDSRRGRQEDFAGGGGRSSGVQEVAEVQGVQNVVGRSLA